MTNNRPPERSVCAVEWDSIQLYKDYISPFRYATVEMTDWTARLQNLNRHIERNAVKSKYLIRLIKLLRPLHVGRDDNDIINCHIERNEVKAK